MQPDALFPCFKGICSLIRYRKQLATCWWEPMEKNTLSINCVFLIPWSRLQGVGIGSILGTASLRQHSQTRAQEQAEAFSLGNQGPYASELYTGMDNVHYLWSGHKEPRKDFIVRFGRSALQTVSLSFLLARSLYVLAAVLWQQFHYICIILHFMTFINDRLVATTLSLTLCLSSSLSHLYIHTFFSYIFSLFTDTQ